jgi:hypothetical protein
LQPLHGAIDAVAQDRHLVLDLSADGV